MLAWPKFYDLIKLVLLDNIHANHCAIVTEEGEDIYGRISTVIAPHGICALWEANEKEIK